MVIYTPVGSHSHLHVLYTRNPFRYNPPAHDLSTLKKKNLKKKQKKQYGYEL
jgi:hypothetical protein